MRRAIRSSKGETIVPQRRGFVWPNRSDWQVIAGIGLLFGAVSTLDIKWIVVLGVAGLVLLRMGARGR